MKRIIFTIVAIFTIFSVDARAQGQNISAVTTFLSNINWPSIYTIPGGNINPLYSAILTAQQRSQALIANPAPTWANAVDVYSAFEAARGLADSPDLLLQISQSLVSLIPISELNASSDSAADREGNNAGFSSDFDLDIPHCGDNLGIIEQSPTPSTGTTTGSASTTKECPCPLPPCIMPSCEPKTDHYTVTKFCHQVRPGGVRPRTQKDCSITDGSFVGEYKGQCQPSNGGCTEWGGPLWFNQADSCNICYRNYIRLDGTVEKLNMCNEGSYERIEIPHPGCQPKDGHDGYVIDTQCEKVAVGKDCKGLCSGRRATVESNCQPSGDPKEASCNPPQAYGGATGGTDNPVTTTPRDPGGPVSTADVPVASGGPHT